MIGSETSPRAWQKTWEILEVLSIIYQPEIRTFPGPAMQREQKACWLSAQTQQENTAFAEGAGRGDRAEKQQEAVVVTGDDLLPKLVLLV